jgi:hypothetical protein
MRNVNIIALRNHFLGRYGHVSDEGLAAPFIYFCSHTKKTTYLYMPIRQLHTFQHWYLTAYFFQKDFLIINTVLPLEVGIFFV